MHPRLAPGIHVLRRPDRRLQLGLARDHAVVLPETGELRESLRLLTRGEATDDELPAAVRPLLGTPRPPVSGRVAVTGFGHPAGRRLVTRLRALNDEAGLTRADRVVDVVVLAGVGEPPRELVDRWAQLGVPHLLVRLTEGHAEVGPFVVPGRTACLRCADAAATDEDPAWPLLLEQYVALSSRDREDGIPEPVDPLLADLACAWAARDLVSYLQGHRPTSWSATLRIDPLLHDLRTTEWLRHPACGCAWTMAG